MQRAFKITNSNWIIESEVGTFAIFRILGDANLVLNQSTIVVGDGILGNGGQSGVGPGAPITDLGAIFVKAAEFKNDQGGFNSGESLSSGDTVFSFNDSRAAGSRSTNQPMSAQAAAPRIDAKTRMKATCLTVRAPRSRCRPTSRLTMAPSPNIVTGRKAMYHD